MSNEQASAPPPYNEKDSNRNQGSFPNQPMTYPPLPQQQMNYPPQMFIPGEFPVQYACPNCRQLIITRIEKQNGLLTWLLVGGLCLFGCWFGCCLIPLCVDDCKDTVHYCPNCSTLLGVKNRI